MFFKGSYCSTLSSTLCIALYSASFFSVMFKIKRFVRYGDGSLRVKEGGVGKV